MYIYCSVLHKTFQSSCVPFSTSSDTSSGKSDATKEVPSTCTSETPPTTESSVQKPAESSIDQPNDSSSVDEAASSTAASSTSESERFVLVYFILEDYIPFKTLNFCVKFWFLLELKNTMLLLLQKVPKIFHIKNLFIIFCIPALDVHIFFALQFFLYFDLLNLEMLLY